MNNMNDNTTNGEFILQHLSNMEMETSPTTLVFSPRRQLSLPPGSFLITPDCDYSLVSGCTLARRNFEFQKWATGSKYIGQIATPSGRNVLAIGLVRARVNMTVRFTFGGADNMEVAGFDDVVSFMVYQEEPSSADGVFSLGRCSPLCCRGWCRPASLPVTLFSGQQDQQQDQQQQAQQTNASGNANNFSIDSGSNTSIGMDIWGTYTQ